MEVQKDVKTDYHVPIDEQTLVKEEVVDIKQETEDIGNSYCDNQELVCFQNAFEEQTIKEDLSKDTKEFLFSFTQPVDAKDLKLTVGETEFSKVFPDNILIKTEPAEEGEATYFKVFNPQTSSTVDKTFSNSSICKTSYKYVKKEITEDEMEFEEHSIDMIPNRRVCKRSYKCVKEEIPEDEIESEERINDLKEDSGSKKKKGEFKCDECKFVFLNRESGYNLMEYCTIKHKSNRFHIFSCKSCKYSTRREDSFRKHVHYEHSSECGYKCAYCEYSNAIKGKLSEHLKIVHDHIDLKCRICDAKFRNRVSILHHVKSQHSVEGEAFSCDRCDYNTKIKENSIHHMEKHLTDQLPCLYCDYFSKSDNDLICHVIIAHSEKREFPCTECVLRFDLFPSFLEHYKLRHFNDPEKLRCGSCSYRTKWKMNMLQHITMKHNLVRPFQCRLCKVRFKEQKLLEFHQRMKHNSANWFRCEFCKYRFALKNELTVHVKRLHRDDLLLFECDLCTSVFFGKENLAVHVRIQHSPYQKVYKCTTCNYTSKLRENLFSHVQVYRGGKVFRCEFCRHTFNSDTTLDDHVKIYHKGKLVSCPVCNQSFRSKNALADHLGMNHSENGVFLCRVCYDTFDNATAFVTHYRQKHHRSLDVAFCQFCVFTASSKKELSQHVALIHSEKRPFRCQVCIHYASSKTELIQHLKDEHNFI